MNVVPAATLKILDEMEMLRSLDRSWLAKEWKGLSLSGNDRSLKEGVEWKGLDWTARHQKGVRN